MTDTPDFVPLAESGWEQLALDELGELFWKPVAGAQVAPGSGERETWADLLIRPRLREAMIRLNPDVPRGYIDQALAEIVTPASQDAITENLRVHRFLTEGYRGLTYVDEDGRERTPTFRLVGAEPTENDWLAVNQVTVVQGEIERRFDVVLYLNGMPVAILELKKAGSVHADVAAAYAQLATYVRELPMAFRFAVLVVASDGVDARYGTPFTPLNHFAPWNVDDDGAVVSPGAESTGLELALHGLFNQERFGQLLRGFVAFDESKEHGLAKRIAKPHQYFAVTKAVGSTVEAVGHDGRAGVVWHTQGSGKSMEMELYANLVMRHPKLRNPTIVVVTDRKELDGQLYDGFARSLLLPEKPHKVERREELRAELSGRTSGGLYFTTLQKFGRTLEERRAGLEHPRLSDRSNIVLIVDEAHRSHYDDLDGYARQVRDALPRATLIAFTGTPLTTTERDTREVFGDYIDVYDLTRAVEDGATLPVSFESRLIKVALADEVTQDTIDAAADEATVGLDDTERDRIEKSVAVVNAVYGAPQRLELLAGDIVEHWEARRAAMIPQLSEPDEPPVPGKALIVCATREIAANLYAQVVALRPEWHSDELDRGRIKVVYSGTASDEPPVADHVRRESANARVKERLRDPADELELVIVKDMMLTGYDSPPLHTLYLDRPMKGALLMQTLARVNRTFRGKQDGLLVAYAPIAENLTRALAEYTRTDQEARPVGRPVEAAAALTHDLLDQLRDVLSGFDWRAVLRTGGAKAAVRAVGGALEYLRNPATPPCDDEPRAVRFRRLSSQLARAWALAGRSQELAPVRSEAQFYEEVRVWMAKLDAADRQARGEPVPDEVRRLLTRLVADSVASIDVLDIYGEAGVPRPSITELDAAHLATLTAAEHPHLAIEALRRLIEEETRRVARYNLARQRAFSERLVELMTRYTNAQLTSAEIIAALVEMAHDVATEGDRGRRFSPPLDDDELAFYDAVASNDSALELQGESVLAEIARELVTIMRRDVRTDWTVRDDVRAKLRSSIKRLLVRYDYPPDRQPEAIRLVIEQMEAMAPRLAA